MAKRPRLKGKELIRVLESIDFSVVRVKGSHHILRHPDGRSTVVPVHSGEVIGAGLFNKILRDIEMTAEEFESLL